MMVARVLSLTLTLFTSALLAACASAPTAAAPKPPPPLTFEQKMFWILRLEEDRVLEQAAPPEQIPPVVTPPAGRGGKQIAVVPPPPPKPPDLLVLMRDNEPRIRRRAALAAGRTQLPAALAPLAALLREEPDPEVRQMAAFAIGLIGRPQSAAGGARPEVDATVTDALVAALSDASPIVQGRAAEALGSIGHNAAAQAIGAMMAAHVQTGALAGVAPDDLGYPKDPPLEAVRLGAAALVRLNAYDALASALTGSGGQPVSHWWPIAYAFQRIGDPRAASVLLSLLQSEGALTRAFAARGLGATKDQRAIKPLVTALARGEELPSVRIQAARSLAALRAADAVEPLTRIISTPKADANLRLEALTALGQIASPASVDIFIDLLTETWPAIRAAALQGLARADADTFLTAISSLDPDPQWSVRAVLATALTSLDATRAVPRLTAMLADEDQRVIPAVLNALVAVNAPGIEKTLVERLGAEDVVVRLAAANGLTRLKARTAAPALVAAYERAQRDPTYVARSAILAAVAALDPAAARPLLDKAMGDHDWAVRIRAAGLLRSIDPAADVSRIRPAPPAAVAELNNLPALIAPAVSPTAYIDTEKGLIQIELAPLDAPRTVMNFVELTRRAFFGGTPLHRVVPDFVVQDGDPRGDGEGGPGYTIRDEINQLPYLRGTVGMALDWEDTGGSQFFITHSPQPHLDGRYTVFGRVVAGLDVLDQLTQWDQIRSVRIWDGVNWIGQ